VQGKTTLVGVDWRARLIGKLLTIGTLSLMLGVLYLLLTLVLVPSLDRSGVPIGHTVAALVVAMLAMPLRNRLGQAVNRRLNRGWQTSPEMLRDIGSALSRTISPDGLYTILVEDLPQRLRLQSAMLWMLEPPDDHAFIVLDHSALRRDMMLRQNGAIARQLADTATYLLIPTADPDIDWTPMTNQGIRLVLPLRVGNRLIGIYGCGGPQRGDLYAERVINVLLMLAPSVASALENARAYTTIAQLNDDLRAIDQLKAEFIQSVGHELRTPLTTLSLAMQLFDRQSEMTPMLANITRTGVAQLQALVDRVLAFDLGLAPLPSDHPPPAVAIRLAPLLEEIIDQYSSIADAKGMRFVLRVPRDLAALAHIASFCRAVHEIIDNAVRYSQSGTVTIAAMRYDGLALISIADEGPGIPNEERDRLFVAFYRGSGTRALSATPGTGLGLSIARRDIEAQGGQVWLAHTSPSGSTMCVALPAAIPAESMSHEEEQARVVGA
jgi:signal transduction histidine kinase